MLLSVVLSSALLFVSLSIGASYESAQLKMSRGMAGTATITVSAKPQSDGQAAWITDSDIPDNEDIKHKVGILESPALYNEDGYYESFDLLAADLDNLNKINAPRLISGNMDDFSGYQCLLYGTAGGVLGIVSGYGLLSVMLRQLGASLPQGIEIPLVVSPFTIFAAAAVAIMVSFLSAYLPIRRASKLPVKDIVLGLVEESKISNKAKLVFGAILLLYPLFCPMW